MSEAKQPIVTDKSAPGHWRVTLDNPPINVIDDRMYDALYDLVGEIEADPTLKVVTFESANPDFFLAHYSSAEPRSRFGTPRWIAAARRLAASSALSVAVIRGCVRGGGSELTLGLDVRFASRERAVFGQPEVGMGLIPGGGALQRLPLLVGRARTLEIVLGADDSATAERYGWINRAVPDADLDAFVANFVRRIVSFDKQALSTAKSIINASGLPEPAQLQATQDLFFKTYAWDGAKERAPLLRARGLGKPGEYELHLGHHLADLMP